MKVRKSTKAVLSRKKSNDMLSDVVKAVKTIKPGEEFDVPADLVGGNFYSVLSCAEAFLGKKLITRNRSKDGKTRTVYCL